MIPTFTLGVVLLVTQQQPASTPSASQAVAPLQARSRRATFLQSDEGSVTSMAFSPDGKTLAAGYTRASNTAGGVVLWDVAGRKRVVEKPLPVTEGSVSSLAFSPCGKTLAAGYAYVHHLYSDGGVVLWDVADRRRVIQAPMPVREGGWQAWPSALMAISWPPDTTSASEQVMEWCCGTWPGASAWSKNLCL